MNSFFCLMAAVLVCAGLAGAFLGEPLAHAQGDDNDYVDVGLILEVPAEAITGASLRRKLNIIVVNHGSRTAYDVEVVVKIESPEDSSYFLAPSDYHIIAEILEIPVGSVSQGDDKYSLRWSIPTLGGGVRETLDVLIIHKALARDAPETFDNASYPHEHYGEVTTSSFESDLHKGNNTHRVWSYRTSPTSSIFYQVGGNYSVAVSVDHPAASPGDTVTFTIKTDRADPYPDVTGASIPPIDLKVDIELTDGLSVTGSPTYRPSNKADSVEYSNGVFNIGTLKAGEPLKNEVDLPITVAANAAGNRQCLTATLTGNPPPGSGPYDDYISDNVAKLCLGPAPAGEQVVLDDGDVDLFTWYDCVGKTIAPCNDSDSLELVVTGDAAPEFGTVFQPSQVVVHVPDPEGRTISSASGSTASVWSTGVANFTGLPGGEDRPGAVVAVNASLLNYKPTTDTNDPAANWGVDHPQWSNWHTGHIKVTAVVPADDQDNPLGEIKGWRKTNPPDELFWGNDVDPGNTTNPTLLMDYNMYLGDSNEAVGGWRDERYIEFSALGTYLLKVTTTVAYDDDGNDSTDTVSYSDTETYTFHVGPLTDLSVAGGASPHVAADRNALTIVAANNGPDLEADTQVKIALPPGALVEDYVASDGTYSNGVWTLPGLKLRDYRRSQGRPEAATLTLILKEGGGIPQEPTTATISLTDNSYNVCIDSDRNTLAHSNHADCKADSATTNVWHSAVCVQDSDQTVNTTTTHDTLAKCGTQTGHTWTANVCANEDGKVIAGRNEPECDGWYTGTIYDPPANNTAKITAAKGTGGGGPAAPRFADRPVLNWEAVPHVNDWPVDKYEVNYLHGNEWEWLAYVPGTQTHFADTSSSGRTYRVRALNEAGVPGFWSRAASRASYRQASPPLNVVAVAGAAGEVVVSWDPSSDDEGSPITYYQVQWSRNGTGGWSNACRSDGPSDLSCTQTGIPAGETRYYRVAAHTAQGTGVWSDLAVATTIPGVPSAPRGLSASRAPQDLGGETILAIRLTWSAPATDNGSPIYAYAIEYVDYDQSAGRCGTDWQYLGGDPGIHSNDPPTREFLDTGEYSWIGLEPGAHRCYRVSAINSAGEGPFSNVASASAGGAVPPDEWIHLDGEADGQNAITLYWGEPHYDGGAPVTSYQLQFSADGENWRNLTSTSGSARSYTHTGRKVGETWHYRIRARNSAGWSEWSDPISVTIAEGATANIAQPSLTVRATTTTEVLLSWNSLCNPNREGDCENKGIDGYMVEYSEDGGLYGWERLSWVGTDQTKIVDPTVEPGATRYYRVAGYQEVDRRQLLGRWSQIKSVTTADFVVGAPQNLTVTAEGERGLKLVWDEVTEGRDAASITGYRIERNTPGDDGTDFDTSWVVRQTNRKSNTYVDTGLTPNTDYYYRVAAVTRNGSVPWIGPYSEIERFFIPPPGN